MFQPEPAPFASVYQNHPTSPFSLLTQQSSLDAPPERRTPPLDPTLFDFGYRVAAAVGGGGGAFGPGLGIGSAPGPGARTGPSLGALRPGSALSESARDADADAEERDGIAFSGLTGDAAGVGAAPAHCCRIPGPVLQPATTPLVTPSTKTAAVTGPPETAPTTRNTASILATRTRSFYSAPSPSSLSALSCSDSAASHTSYSSGTALSASPTPSCAAASPYPQAASGRQHHHQPHSRNQPRIRRRESQSALATMDGQDKQDQHSVAAQQAAAKDYQPEYHVPMVGDLTPSSAITQEYAKADPVYVEKTINLPQQFSHYRPIRGDGNCGWRAIGYSYFEKLVAGGNRAVIDGEVVRLNDFNNTCLASHGGFGYWEDFAEAFINLLVEVAEAVAIDLNGAQFLVHQRWNDEELNNHIIYYLRMLASTHLKMNVATYDPFVADSGGIGPYCSANIEAVNKEIEHVGVSALVNILLKPVNFALQVAYLDLSPGTAPNIYRFPEEANGQDDGAFASVIYTLFRPTHYDILYRTTPPALVQAQAPADYPIQVHRVAFNDGPEISSTPAGMPDFSAAEFEALSMIPGFGASAMSPSVGDVFSPQPQGPWTPYPDAFSPAASSPHAMTESTPSAMAAAPSPEAPSMQPLKIHQPTPGPGPGAVPLIGPIPSPLMRAMAQSSGPNCTIRFSPLQLQYDGGAFPDSAFHVTTNTFKNSVWNRAHFGNPDFHPEEWSPEDENVDGRLASRKKSR